ncbi:MAG TPA: metallophosphoesterase [Mobilitalea sp.]|nr:metallophosphoesterase [Mobilitalea sp.]
MKVLIISDTHGRNLDVLRVVEKVSPIDLLIHLGDFEGGEEYIKSIVPCHTEMVSGNNDFFSRLPKEKIIKIGKYTVMLTHGHRYGVNYSTYDLREAASRHQANIVMFGHTHVPMIDMNDDVWAINPGSLSLPRQHGRIPTFIIMEIDAAGEAHFTLNYLNESEDRLNYGY